MTSESIGFLYKFITPKFHEVGGNNFHFFSHPTIDAFYFFFLFSLKIRKLFFFCIFPNKSGMIMKPLHYFQFFFLKWRTHFYFYYYFSWLPVFNVIFTSLDATLSPLKEKKKKNSEVVDCLV